MDTKANTKAISEIAASQMGLITSAQAARFGVSRNVLAYMARVGKVERVEHGVYRVCGAPYSVNQDIYAVWLSSAPAQMAHERYSDFDGTVVGGRSAAAIHGIGDFFISPYRFFTHTRLNSKRKNIIFTKRLVDKADVVFTDFGLPLTSITRTIYDLIYDNEELSLFSGAFTDALKDKSFDADRLRVLFMEQLASKRCIYEQYFDEMMNIVNG
ncbi:MAG: type IV toxin-antitoxin system AbiEi family antitoxin domain-containing protein [Coriobacteriales bacterium]|jgi:predicted transcriptional regulator of viral defense system|nr:type IV toxin-antitoxin system AbiEi family antitoxin domain-containing protein [Coriobacteriales bacterium]